MTGFIRSQTRVLIRRHYSSVAPIERRGSRIVSGGGDTLSKHCQSHCKQAAPRSTPSRADARLSLSLLSPFWCALPIHVRSTRHLSHSGCGCLLLISCGTACRARDLLAASLHRPHCPSPDSRDADHCCYPTTPSSSCDGQRCSLLLSFLSPAAAHSSRAVPFPTMVSHCSLERSKLTTSDTGLISQPILSHPASVTTSLC